MKKIKLTTDKRYYPLFLFLTGIILFIANGWIILDLKGKKQFHEIEWNNRSILNSMLDTALANDQYIDTYFTNNIRKNILTKDSFDRESGYQRLADSLYYDNWKKHEVTGKIRSEDVINNYKATIEKNRQKTITDSSLYTLHSQKLIDTALYAFRTRQRNTLLTIKSKMAALTDSALYITFIKDHLFIRDTLEPGDLRANNKTCECTNTVHVVFIDTSLPTGQIAYNYPLQFHWYDADHFFSKYGSFGMWALLLIILATAYWVMIFALPKDMKNSRDVFKTADENVRKRYIYIVIILCIALCIYTLFSGNRLIRPELFMLSLTKIFIYVNFLGYTCAAICLCGMMFCYIEVQASIDNLNADATSSTSFPDRYVQLYKKFDFYFIITAIILSVAVVTTGVFFSSLNMLDFVKQFSRSIGRTAFSYDLVYLFGLINSMVLLAVYLPVKRTFNSAKTKALKIDPNIATQLGPDKSASFMSGPMKRLLEVVIASSPLMAGFLQTFLDSLFQ